MKGLIDVVEDGDRDQVLAREPCEAAASLLFAVATGVRGREGLPPPVVGEAINVVGMLHVARCQEGEQTPAAESPDFAAALVLLDLADLCGAEVSRRMLPIIEDLRRRHQDDRQRLLSFAHPRSLIWRLPVGTEQIALNLLLHTVAAALAPAEDPSLPFLRARAWEFSRHWHEAGGTPEDLGQALVAARESVAALPSDGEMTAGYLAQLAESAYVYYKVSRDRGFLDEGVAAARRGAAAAPPGSRAEMVCLNTLCALLPETEDAAALSEAADAGARAAEACAGDDPLRHEVFYHYGTVLFHRSWTNRDVVGMRAAVDVLREAVALALPGLPARALLLSRLALTMRNLYAATSDAALLSEAVRLARESLTAGGDDLRVRASCLTNLAVLLVEDHLWRADDDALVESIAASREALALLDEATPEERAPTESVLGNAMRNLFTRTGDTAVLDESISLLRTATAAMRAAEPQYATTSALLMRALSARGNDSDLEEAAAVGARALAGVSVGTPEHPVALVAYAEALGISALKRGDTSLLPRAIDALEEAVEGTFPGDLGRPLLLRSLGSMLEARFQLTGDLTLLDEGIRRMRQAVAEGSGTARDIPLLLSGLAALLRRRYECTGDRSVLDEGVEAVRSAVVAASQADQQRAAGVRELGRLLRARADPDDLDEAVRALREAGDAQHTAEALRDRFRLRGDPADLAESMRLLRALADTPAEGVRTQLQAAWSWGETAAEHQRWEEAAEGFAAAVRILPTAVTRRLPRAEQEMALRSNAYLAQDAAACALHLGDLARALELLEHGRGVLFAQALESRVDLDELAARAPELAARVGRLRDLLDIGTDAHGTIIEAGLGAERRWRLAAEWEEALAEVRAMGLLTLPRAQDLLEAVGAHPVVIVNASQYRSDALILQDGGIEVVPLPLLDTKTAAEQAGRFHAGVQVSMKADTRLERMLALSYADETLSWLWRAVAGPVLSALGMSRRARGRPRPRVRWCLTGPLAYLPMHAAGRPGRRGVLDLVVSSYTSTVRALAHAARQPPAPPQMRRPLVVAVGDTPGMADLPATAVEAERIARCFPEAVLLSQPSRQELLDALPSHAWLHFAGHAYADPRRPSRSSLMLGAERLTVLDIARQDLPHAELAYLSACQTAAASGAIPDEAVNLASAFQLAGFEHVIATLWSIRDEVAARAADHVYGLLDPTAPPGDHVAAAVHSACLHLRDRYPTRPDLWAALIHTGP